jgi:hypothetical protein
LPAIRLTVKQHGFAEDGQNTLKPSKKHGFPASACPEPRHGGIKVLLLVAGYWLLVENHVKLEG